MIVIVFFMIATIVLCIVYEAHRNRQEIPEAKCNKVEEEEIDPYQGAETERPIVAAAQASRAGDHSVIQDDEDFSDSDE